ncbi:DDE-type integrase/transposase/recombinase [Dankookia sp. GCM10030260]|uniref:DDE-type integrase/transposase/recombinase n=1 Tax=Dankookia sp. GCM10030260 TaxID=3273390 RepID=UPI00361925B7
MIAGDNLDPGMSLQPSRHRSLVAVGQQVDDAPQLQVAEGGAVALAPPPCPLVDLYLYVAIDWCSRSVHLTVKDDGTEKSAIAFLHKVAAAFPFHLTHVLTDNGSCFTAAFAKVCAELGAEYRHTKPRSPQTNGMVKRFNGRVGSEVIAITVYSHAQLEATPCWPWAMSRPRACSTSEPQQAAAGRRQRFSGRPMTRRYSPGSASRAWLATPQPPCVGTGPR